MIMNKEEKIEIKLKTNAKGIDSIKEFRKVHNKEFQQALHSMQQIIENNYMQLVLLKATNESPTNFRVHEIRKDNQPSAFGLIQYDIEDNHILCRFTPISKLI